MFGSAVGRHGEAVGTWQSAPLGNGGPTIDPQLQRRRRAIYCGSSVNRRAPILGLRAGEALAGLAAELRAAVKAAGNAEYKAKRFETPRPLTSSVTPLAPPSPFGGRWISSDGERMPAK